MLRFLHSQTSSSRQHGFSLIELVIVVGVTGLLFSGLWRLMATGNGQLREQTAADQMNQLVNATKGFLTSQQGQAFLGGQAANSVVQLQLPTATAAGTGGCGAALNALQGGVLPVDAYCTFLPAGFNLGILAPTLNSYGQAYQVFVRKDATIAPNRPQTYDFIILTTGGDTIPDSSGGRIAANIGSNGGFIFSNNTCGAPVTDLACGAFASFNLNVNTAPLVTPGSGHIVTLTSSTLNSAANTNWLARVRVGGDGDPALGTNTFNTMTVPLHMSAANPLYMDGGSINMSTVGAAAGGGAINLAGGTINMQGGTMSGIGSININRLDGNIPVTISTTGAVPSSTTLTVSGQLCSFLTDPPGTCDPALGITGNINITHDIAVGGNSSFNNATAASFTYNSDISLKKNITPLTNSLDKISQLQGYNFIWRKDNRPDIGVVAQDVQKIYPDLVHANQEGKLGVEYGNLVAPLIEAVKELRQQNITLQKRLDAQEKQLEELQKVAKEP